MSGLLLNSSENVVLIGTEWSSTFSDAIAIEISGGGTILNYFRYPTTLGTYQSTEGIDMIEVSGTGTTSAYVMVGNISSNIFALSLDASFNYVDMRSYDVDGADFSTQQAVALIGYESRFFITGRLQETDNTGNQVTRTFLAQVNARQGIVPFLELQATQKYDIPASGNYPTDIVESNGTGDFVIAGVAEICEGGTCVGSFGKPYMMELNNNGSVIQTSYYLGDKKYGHVRDVDDISSGFLLSGMLWTDPLNIDQDNFIARTSSQLVSSDDCMETAQASLIILSFRQDVPLAENLNSFVMDDFTSPFCVNVDAIESRCVNECCSEDEMAFCDVVDNGFTIVVDTVNCEVTIGFQGIDDCHFWRVDWGDGTVDNPLASGQSVTHTYTVEGLYNILLDVQEVNNGQLCYEKRRVEQVDLNCLDCDDINLSASFTCTNTGLSYAFTNTTSVNAPHTIAQYFWEIKQGATTIHFVTTQNTSFIFPAAGSYLVKMEVVVILPNGDVCVDFTSKNIEVMDKSELYNCPIDVLYVLDNSGSISSAEYNQMVSIVNQVTNDIDASLGGLYTNAQFAVAHYGDNVSPFCGDEAAIEFAFTNGSTVLNPVRQFNNSNDDLNNALQLLHDAMVAPYPDPSLVSTIRNLSKRATSDLYVIIFTDAARELNNYAGCANSNMIPYSAAIDLKNNYDANISVVHLSPNPQSSIAAAAISSVGGTYNGTVDPVYSGPDGTTIPRQYIPWNFAAGSVDIISTIPPCTPCLDCDSLQVVSAPVSSGGDCCYNIDVVNTTGQNVPRICATMTTPDWRFASGSWTLGSGLSWSGTPTGTQLCFESTTGNIGPGVINNALGYCLAPQAGATSTTQEVIFTWYTGTDSLYEDVCMDTLRYNCPIMMSDPCVDLIIDSVVCDPVNPYEYFVYYKIQNNATRPYEDIEISNPSPGYFMRDCAGIRPWTTTYFDNTDPDPIPANSTGNQQCFKLLSPTPVLVPDTMCFEVGLYDDDDCCHRVDPICITLDPCCDPCELNGAIATPVNPTDTSCCYELDLINDCRYDFFSRVELEIQTPGVCFGYHALGGPSASNYQMCGSTPSSLCIEPLSGVITEPLLDNILEWCFDKIDPSTPVPQEIVVKWYELRNNCHHVACTDTLFFDCEIAVNDCLVVTDPVLECVEDSSRYRFTFTVTNTSNPSFCATDLDLKIQSPNDLLFRSTLFDRMSIALPPGFCNGSSATYTVDLEDVTGLPASGPLQMQYRLRYAMGDTCCYESFETITPIPPCPGDDTCTVVCDQVGSFEDLDPPTFNWIFDMVEFEGDIIVAGDFTGPSNNVKRWSVCNNRWEAMGDGFDGIVYALEIHQGKLFAGGSFDFSGASPMKSIAMWDPISTTWQNIGDILFSGGRGEVRDLHSISSGMIIGGQFDQAGLLTENDLVNYSSPGVFTSFNSPYTTTDYVTAIGEYNGQLLAGGVYQGMLHQFNGIGWVPFSPGLTDNNSVRQLSGVNTIKQVGSDLWVGGSFDYADNGSGAVPGTRGLAAWDGASWSSTGNLTGSTFLVMDIENTPCGVLVGGATTTIDGVAIPGGLALWDGTTWSDFGSPRPIIQDILYATNTCEDTCSIWTGGEAPFLKWGGGTLVSTEELETEKLDINIYPNPVSDQLIIDFSVHDVQRLNILHSVGAVIESAIPLRSRITVNTSTWTPGVYIIQVVDQNNRSHSYRVVKH